MAELLVGGLAATSLFFLIQFARRHALKVTWWQWYFTGLGIVYAVFVVEVMIGFMREGSPKAAIVIGAVLGFVAVVWWVLLARFVFRRGFSPRPPPPSGTPTRRNRSTEALLITDERRADHV